VTAVPWPVGLRGVTESVVATLGPNDRWNLAALGLRVGEHRPAGAPAVVTARTWGQTRTRGNFRRQGEGVVQFGVDPAVFVEAALDIRERATPVHPSADAWARVAVERFETGTTGGTGHADWALVPTEAGVRGERPRTRSRAEAAVVEATVAASRLDVPTYEEAALLDRLAWLSSVVESAGGPRERRAFERVDDLVDWRARR
jgi:hypothetical protein